MTKPLSIYLDLLRFLAAGAVFLHHANYAHLTGGIPLLWRFADIGPDAVMAFFVLSGYVIAYVADRKEHSARDYFVSRFARLYSVAIPALILTAVLDFVGRALRPELYVAPYFEPGAWQFIAGLGFVNELWFMAARPGSNGPYWSMGYEFWYYVLFAAAFYLRSRWLVVAVCLLVGPKILILFPIWLLGAGLYRLRYQPSPVAGWFFFLAPVAVYIGLRHAGAQGALPVLTGWGASSMAAWDYVVGGLLAMHLIGARVLPMLPFGGSIRYAAGFTFALYLFHYPLLMFLAAMGTNGTVVTLGTLVAVWTLGTLTEQRKDVLRRYLGARLKVGAATRAPP